MRLQPFSPTAWTDLGLEGRLSLKPPGLIGLSFSWNALFAFGATRAPDGSLWEATCFEAFLSLEGHAYLEFNLALDGRWNAYHFDSYRQPQPPSALPGVRLLEFSSAPGRCDATFEIAPSLFGKLARASLTAVIESKEGKISYWALDHAGTQPDFHDARSFVLDCDPARARVSKP